ncbi:MAG: endonuclease/exonuclease/phosphatase family protein [Sphingomonadales bacterium]
MKPKYLKNQLFSCFLCVLIAGCSAFPKPIELPLTEVAKVPEIIEDPETGMKSVEIRVLIYNIAGLPWPIRTGRRGDIKKIGRIFEEMRAAGTEPDIVLLQEAFTMKSQPIARYGGYPNVVGGPDTKDKAPKISDYADPEFSEGRSFWKGEKIGKLLNAGLAILSDYPILENHTRPFKRHECAGFDCVSNKGVMMVLIQIPGVPEPLYILNSHMNSGIAASGVSAERSLMAHNLQVREIQNFIDNFPFEGRAMLFGGDFNMKHDQDRLNSLRDRGRHAIARYYCTNVVDDCEIRLSFDSDEPWLDTQDLQGSIDGDRIKVRPIIIEALFDEPVDGKMLSDHDGYMVTYRLTWNPEDFSNVSDGQEPEDD